MTTESITESTTLPLPCPPTTPPPRSPSAATSEETTNETAAAAAAAAAEIPVSDVPGQGLSTAPAVTASTTSKKRQPSKNTAIQNAALAPDAELVDGVKGVSCTLFLSYSIPHYP